MSVYRPDIRENPYIRHIRPFSGLAQARAAASCLPGTIPDSQTRFRNLFIRQLSRAAQASAVPENRVTGDQGRLPPRAPGVPGCASPQLQHLGALVQEVPRLIQNASRESECTPAIAPRRSSCRARRSSRTARIRWAIASGLLRSVSADEAFPCHRCRSRSGCSCRVLVFRFPRFRQGVDPCGVEQRTDGIRPPHQWQRAARGLRVQHGNTGGCGCVRACAARDQRSGARRPGGASPVFIPQW